MQNETMVPFQAEINFEAAWKELYHYFDTQEQFSKLTSPDKNASGYSLTLAMNRLLAKHTIEVPIQ